MSFFNDHFDHFLAIPTFDPYFPNCNGMVWHKTYHNKFTNNSKCFKSKSFKRGWTINQCSWSVDACWVAEVSIFLGSWTGGRWQMEWNWVVRWCGVPLGANVSSPPPSHSNAALTIIQPSYGRENSNNNFIMVSTLQSDILPHSDDGCHPIVGITI